MTWVLDFTSSLYLGFRHASTSLPPWAQLTTGVPAAVATPHLSRRVAANLCALLDTERAIFTRSTLHAFWDLFLILGERNSRICMDAGTYPIARSGIELAAGRGIPTRTFGHHDPGDLSRQLARDPRDLRPLIVADSFCVGCGRFAPIRHYLAQAQELGGTLVLDDTQALGVFGHSPSEAMPYGSGGGGCLQFKDISCDSIILVNSLAKGFGVPMAVIAGSRNNVTRFETMSVAMVHSSPPSFADLRATENALQLNHASGDALRSRMGMLIRRFQRGLRAVGIHTRNSLFPVQSLALDETQARTLHKSLERMRIRAVLHRPVCQRNATISFIITANHTLMAIDEAVAATAYALRHIRISSGKDTRL